MPEISLRAEQMPASPIRKLVPLADAARARGTKIYHLNIGQPDLPSPKEGLESLKHIDRKVLEYSPSDGYRSLREKLVTYYEQYQIKLSPEEIIVTTGGSEAVLFAFMSCLNPGDEIIVPEPAYANYMAFAISAGAVIRPVVASIENGFALPPIEEFEKLINDRTRGILICNPNNPTGTTLTKPELKKWVDYALANDTLILFDAAYEAFIREDDVPHSIYEIKGAKKCAIEFRSFSKTAGFTGVRCGYTVVPKELTAATLEGERIPLNKLWNRRQSTKFNGTSYITQRAAEAIYTPEGQRQIKETIDYYMDNARTMKQGLEAAGLKVYGGVNAPYIWLKTPDGTSSWRFFEQMLYEANVVGTPGVGFGPSGEGYIRLTAFGKHEDCVEAMKRIRKWLK